MRDWFNVIADDDQLADKFKCLLDITYAPEKELLSKWIEKFVIKDGSKKTIHQFQTTFHSMFWEIYLNEVFINSGLEIHKGVSSPDFYLEKNQHLSCIEAVTSNISNKGEPEKNRTIKDVYGNNDHYKILDESIIRVRNSFLKKDEEYNKKYINYEHVKKSPFVIAIGDFGQINYGQSSYYSILAVLYCAYYDPEDKMELEILGNDNLYREKEYKYKKQHPGINNVELDLGMFTSEKFKNISAVIYSCTLTLGKLTSLSLESQEFNKFVSIENEYGIETINYSGANSGEFLCDGLFVLHNPYAEKPLPKNYFVGKGITNIYYNEESESIIEINCQNLDGYPLKRRRVGCDGYEEFFPDIDDFKFFKVPKRT